MRIILPGLILVLLTACGQRSDMSALPDRGGHAYNPGGPAAGPSGAAAPAATAGRGAGTTEARPGAGETTATVQAGERLYQVAERSGSDLWWLITRNDLVAQPSPGTRLIVKR